MIIGYARVSTKDQKLDAQLDALKTAGAEDVFSDIASGAKSSRPGLDKMKTHLRKGDTLVIQRLDRLGRSMKDLVDWMQWLEDKEVKFKSLDDGIDTSTPGGKLVFHIFGALAEFERNLIRERTRSGLKAARSRGKIGGRKRVLSEKDQKRLKTLYSSGEFTIPELMEQFSCSRATLYKVVKGKY
ncbi:recombinase family protein [Tunicatimonas pelagia]|uniref:recombinase family protein n=1 Tax=Tunicatimonas pelagia TaxID=931531 RepID=UPI002665A60E|nr:recombinase family protein [Tunicatimonas pelagia]WKN44241.1 recombinase family protein [Tunicatimonas pelagia]